MDQSTTAMIILAIACVLFLTDKVPLAISATMAMLAMAFTGIISYEAAFAGFGSTVLFMIIGMTIITRSFFYVGLTKDIGKILNRFISLGEMKFVSVMYAIATFMGAFMNATIVISTFMPILDSLSFETKGKISRKMTYLPMAIGGTIGGHATIISASCIITASGLLAASPYGKGLTFFEPFKIGWAGILISIIYYFTIGPKLQKKCFDFEEKRVESPISDNNGSNDVKRWQKLVSLFTAIICIVLFISGFHIGAVSMAGACVVMLCGCIPTHDAFKSVSWETVFTVAGAIGFANGIAASGAAVRISEFVLDFFGSALGSSPFAMCAVIMLLGTIISNFMSNTATVTLLAPVALSMAQLMGQNPVPFLLAAALGADMAIATPICSAGITFTTTAGYRAKDLLKVGGLLNILIYIAETAAMYIVFFA